MSTTPLWVALLEVPVRLTELAAQWFVQSTLVIAAGLVAGWLLRRRGPALQSVVYRTTLVAAIACPLVAWALGLAGLSVALLGLPSARIVVAELRAADTIEPAPAQPAAALPPENAGPAPIAADQGPRLDQAATIDARAAEFAERGSYAADLPRGTPLASQKEAAGGSSVGILTFTAPPLETEPAPPVWMARPAAIAMALATSAVWLLGTGWLLARLVLAHRRLRQLRASALAAGDEERRLCAELAARLGVRSPELMRTPFATSPCLAGIVWPVILLPEELPSATLSTVLVHELAHLARGDCLWNLLRQAGTAALFFQPLMWRLSTRLETTAEEVCDDYAVQFGADRRTYADMLVRLAERACAPLPSAVVPLVTLRSLLGQRVRRILDRTRALSLSVSVTALCLVLAIGVAATVAAGLLGAGGREVASAEASAETTIDADEANIRADDAAAAGVAGEAATDEDDASTRITGTVRLPDGRAAAGAAVVVVGRERRGFGAAEYGAWPSVIARGMCDDRGHFELSAADLSPSRFMWVQLLVRSADAGLAWRDLNPGDGRAIDLATIDLPAASDCRGRLLSLEGKPAAGLRLVVDKIGQFDLGEFHGVDSDRGGLPAEVWPSDVTTDAEGWFTVRGVPADAQLSLFVDQPPFAPHWWLWKRDDQATHLTPLPPAQLLTGTVEAADTGEPLARGRLQAFTHDGHGMTGVFGEADDAGRFRLNPFPARSYEVTAFAPAGTPYLASPVKFDWPQTATEHAVRIELPRGVLLRGSIKDEKTGQPIARASVQYHPRDDNPNGKGILTGWQAAVLSDEDGHFAMGIPAGAGYVEVLSAGSDYVLREVAQNTLRSATPGGRRLYLNAYASFDVAPDAAEHVVNLTVERGATVRGQVVGVNGRTPKRVLLVHRGIAAPYSDYFRCFPRTIHDGRFELSGVPSEGELPVFLLDPDAKEAKIVNVRAADAARPLRIQLDPCGSVTERFVDGKGQPVPGLSPSIDVVFTPGASMVAIKADSDWQQIFADEELINNFDRQNTWDLMAGEDGRVTVPTLIPGVTYRLLGGDDEGHLAMHREIRVAAGEQLELPDRVVRDESMLQDAAKRWRERHQKNGKTAQSVGAGTEPREAIATAMPPDNAAKPAPDGAAAADVADDAVTLHYRGRVVDADGKPVAGAKLHFAYWVRGGRADDSLRPRATTDADGWFDFSTRRSDFEPDADTTWLSFNLVATADGYGFAKGRSIDFETTGEAAKRLPAERKEYHDNEKRDRQGVLRLVRDDVPLVGQVMSIEGRPVAGARIGVHTLYLNSSGNLDSWEEATKEPKADYYSLRNHTPDQMGGAQWASIIPDVTTDKEGRFALHGVGRERIVELMVTGPAIETSLVKVRTRPGEKIVVPNEWGRPGDTRVDTYFANQFTHVAGPSVPVEGRVTDAETGEPLAGIAISAGRQGSFLGSGKTHIATVTDADGRYRLDGLTISTEEGVYALPPASTAYLPAGVEITTQLGGAPVMHDFKLRRGVWVRGRTVDERTGKPVSGAVQYFAFQGNPHLADYPGLSRIDIAHERRANKEGHFEIAVPPGQGILAFMADDSRNFRRGAGAESITVPTYDNGGPSKMFRTVPYSLVRENENLLRQLDPAPGDEPIEITLALTSGVDIVARMLDPDGQPLSGGMASGSVLAGAWDPIFGDSFRVVVYEGEDARDLFVYHPERDLAGYFRLEADPPLELAIKLVPAGSLRGRLVDDNGEPLRRVRLSGAGLPSAKIRNYDMRLATDDDGRFLIRGLVPGRQHTVFGAGNNTYGRVVDGATVEAGQTTDVGDVKLLPPEEKMASASPGDTPAATAAPPKNDNPAKPLPAGTFTANAKAGARAMAKADAKRKSKNRLNWSYVAVGESPSPREPEGDTIVVKGLVVDPQGQPVAGGDVFAVSMVGNTLGKSGPLAATKSDAAGRFQIEYPKAQDSPMPQAWRYVNIVASAPGFAPAWAPFEEIEPGQEPTLRLAADDPLEGRVVDLEGRPIHGATLQVVALLTNAKDDVSQWLEALRSGEPQTPASGKPKAVVRQLPAGIDALANTAKTDADGRFRLSGVGRGRVARLRVSGGGVAVAQFYAATQQMEPIVLDMGAGSFKFNETYFGNRFQYVAAPSQPVEGLIRDAKTGEAIPNVRVVSDRLAGTNVSGMHTVETIADAAGRYRLDSLPKGEGNRILAIPADDQPYFVRAFDVPAPPGLEPVKLDLDLERGVWITGRVFDKQSGKPVAASMYYNPWPDNPLTKDLREFNGSTVPALFSRYRTDAEGRYRVVGLPGHGLIEARCSPSQPYPTGQGIRDVADLPNRETFKFAISFGSWSTSTAVREIRAADGEQEIAVDIALDPGARLPLAVVDPDGKPLSGVTARGLWPKGQHHEENGVGPTIEAIALAPDEKRLVLIHHKERKLGKAVRVSAADGPGPVTEKLAPCGTITARLLDGDGEPVRGAHVRFDVLDGDFGLHLYSETTDETGRFTNSLVPSGCEYSIYCQSEAGSAVLAKTISVAPGETVDLGEIDVTSEARPEPRRTLPGAVGHQGARDSSNAQNGSTGKAPQP